MSPARRSRANGAIGLLVLASTAFPVEPAIGGGLIFEDDFESGRTCKWWGFGTPTCPGFEIQAPPIEVLAGEEKYVCYYFHTPNAATMGIRRWASASSSGVRHLIVYATYDTNWNTVDRQPPGTVTVHPCGFSEGGGNDGWLYDAYTANADLALPADDGGGDPLAFEILAGQPGYVQMRLVNEGDQPIQASVRLGAEALDTGVVYAKTASYVTTNVLLNLPTGESTASLTCATPPAVEFWWFSTHTNRLGTGATVEDGLTTLVQTTDWEHPSSTVLSDPNFHTFSGSGLTFSCSYDNDTGDTVTFGEDELTKENCIAIGFFFPATRPMACHNFSGPF